MKLLRDRSLLNPLIVAVCLQLAQQLSGINAVGGKGGFRLGGGVVLVGMGWGILLVGRFKACSMAR